MGNVAMPNVLFVMVDAFRADRCFGADRGCRTPYLDGLRSRSTVFTNAFSTASMTTCCTASIMTGTYPFVHGIRSLADHRLSNEFLTMAEAFKTRGYYTWAEVTGPLLPETGLNRGFDHFSHRKYTQTLDTEWGDQLVTQMTQGFHQPWFGFVHLWELHNPRHVMPKYNNVKFGRNLYERAVSSLDGQLGNRLGTLGKDIFIVITGDHGEYASDSQAGKVIGQLKSPFKWLKKRVPGFKKLKKVSPKVFKGIDRLSQKDNDIYYNWLGHGFHVYDPLVHVPLILHGPDRFPAGLEISHIASHVDILPTVASVFDLALTDTTHLSGVNLMPIIQSLGKSANGRSVYMEASGGRSTPSPDQWLVAARTEHYKYIRGLVDQTLPEELYDVQTDPSEQNNLILGMPTVAEAMRTKLQEMLCSGVPSIKSAPTYSEQELVQLQSRLQDLGYLD